MTTTPRSRFAKIVQSPRCELARGALEIARIAYPDLDPDASLAELDRLADAVRPRLMPGFSAVDRALTVSRFLFDECGFRGNTDDYYDVRNSFLNDVVTRRMGIPITLSTVLMEVGARVGVPFEGVGFPGHFLVRALDGDRSVVIDPFNRGAVLGREELEELLARVAGPDARLDPTHLAPLGKIQILTRMLVNLAGVYGKAGDLFRSLEVLERLHLLDPENPKISQDLENLRRRCDSLN